VKKPFNAPKQLKFTIVGILNTSLDFFIFILLTTLGLTPILGNTTSTSCGMLCSFLLNRSFVFGPSGSKTHHEIMKFLLVTLVGLWVLQNIVIIGCNWMLNSLFTTKNSIVFNATSKLLATGVSLTWNYYCYKNYVFKKRAD